MHKDKVIILLQLSLIIILGFVAYANSLQGGFVWDDYGLVVNNAYIKSWSNLGNVFTQSFGSGGGGGSDFYRPLQAVIHMIDYSLFGLSPPGYHLTNILLHILVALAVYWFTHTLFSRRALAFVAGLLFVVHPLHTETVCYISGISDSLSLLFILLSLTFYIKSSYVNNTEPYILSLFLFILALFSKDNAIIMPLLILLYYYAFQKKIEIRRILPFFFILSGYILFRFIISDNFVFPAVSLELLLKRVPGFFVAVTRYIRLLIFPSDLRLDYGSEIFKVTDARAILGALFLLALAVLAHLKRKNNPLASFSVLWFLAALIPVSNIYPISEFLMMEHWLYAPSLGFFLILAGLICYPARNRSIVFLLKAFLIIIIAVYSFLTLQQNKNWRDPVTLYERAIRYDPQSWIIYNQLGNEYLKARDYGKAVSCYKESIRLNPKLKGAYNNLANAYKITGNDAGAIAVYKIIVEIDPADYKAYLNLGALYDRKGDKKEAEVFYGRAGEIIGGLVNRYFEQANKYKENGKNEKAVIFYKKALEINPRDIILYDELAATYVLMGRSKEAIPLYLKALEINPDSGILHNNLAVAYYCTRQYELAVKHIDMALDRGYEVSGKFLEMTSKYRISR